MAKVHCMGRSNNDGICVGGKCVACGGEAEMCPVTDCVGDKLMFVDPAQNPDCPCLATFGYEHYCRCPQRLEAYRRDKK